MANFVLVPGAWLGSWVWQPVVAELHKAGHNVVSVTLSGLAERADVPVEEIGLATHVADVLAALGELTNVVLVGHSYSGIVVGQAAELAGEQVRHTVYVDANLPRDGLAMTDLWSAEGREQVTDLIERNAGWWPPRGADRAARRGGPALISLFQRVIRRGSTLEQASTGALHASWASVRADCI
jgi:pimeloyl-ACP methyl ester carboxylesterase